MVYLIESGIYDIIGPIFVGQLILLGVILHLYRITYKKDLSYDRINRESPSKWISKEFLVTGYWALQPVANFLIASKISANGVSFIGLGFGLLSGIAFGFGHFGFGSIFLIISGMFDALDGIVARMHPEPNPAGVVLDSALDRYVEFFILGGLLVHYQNQPWIMVLCLLALMGSFMVSYSTAKSEAIDYKLKFRGLKRLERLTLLGFGALIAPLSIRWFEIDMGLPYKTGIPAVVAVAIIAIWGNFSAIMRLYEIQIHTNTKNLTR